MGEKSLSKPYPSEIRFEAYASALMRRSTLLFNLPAIVYLALVFIAISWAEYFGPGEDSWFWWDFVRILLPAVIGFLFSLAMGIFVAHHVRLQGGFITKQIILSVFICSAALPLITYIVEHYFNIYLFIYKVMPKYDPSGFSPPTFLHLPSSRPVFSLPTFFLFLLFGFLYCLSINIVSLWLLKRYDRRSRPNRSFNSDPAATGS